MVKPRAVRAYFFITALFLSALLLIFDSLISIRAQQTPSNVSTERERGIKLYNQHDDKNAIEALRAATKQHKEDADAWYYLGLALNRSNEVKNARKAFETAIKLRPDFAAAHTGFAYTLLLTNRLKDATREAERALLLGAQGAEAHYIISVARLREQSPSKALAEAEAALQSETNFAPALLVKSQAILSLISEATAMRRPGASVILSKEEQKENRILVAKRFKDAADSLEKFLKLSPNTVNVETWRKQLEALRVYAELADKTESERTVFSGDEVTTRAQLLSKPEPAYTDTARENGISGTVRLKVILAGDGTVKHILIFQSLNAGLTEEAIKAARKIKFIPAIKDNHPVSTSVMLEYVFNIG